MMTGAHEDRMEAALHAVEVIKEELQLEAIRFAKGEIPEEKLYEASDKLAAAQAHVQAIRFNHR
jgi:uncharacterized membrane protein